MKKIYKILNFIFSFFDIKEEIEDDDCCTGKFDNGAYKNNVFCNFRQ